MTVWVVALPVWGERYLSIFEQAAWPALKIALGELNGDRIILAIHTDQQDRMKRLTGDFQSIINGVPGHDSAFHSLSEAHRWVLLNSPVDAHVVLLTADLVLSQGALLASARRLATGVRAIACMGMRVSDTELPTPGLPPRQLLAWGWEHRHPMTKECTWPNGESYDIWRMYFEKGDEACCRLALPHPLVVIREHRTLNDFYPTIDVNLLMHFNWEAGEIHLVTDNDELGLIELSPPDKEFVRTVPMYRRYEEFLPSIPTITQIGVPRQNWFFNHKIIVKGTGGDCGDQQVVDRMVHGR